MLERSSRVPTIAETYSPVITSTPQHTAQNVAIDQSVHVRLRQRCLGTGKDYALMLLCLDDTIWMRRCRTHMQLTPGQLVFVTPSDARDIQFLGRGSVCLVQYPHSAIQARGGRLPAITVGPVDSESGLGALVRQLIIDLCRTEKGDDIAVMQETFFYLMGPLLSRYSTTRKTLHSIPARIINLIESQLADPDLSPEVIALACNLSLRSLQRRFSRSGESIGHWIRRRRLERCHADLTNPRWRKQSIASIAFRWGFVEQAHFSRCFRQQYGCSPRELRMRNDALGADQGDPG